MSTLYDEITPFKHRGFFATIIGVLIGGGCLIALPTQAAEGQQFFGASPESFSTFYNFPGAPHIAISNHGNIVRYEGPTGYEHIGIGAFSEGYVLCYGSAAAYDLGDVETGFGAASASCSGPKCTITRNTTDGKMQLKQVITKNAVLERSLNVEMTIKNLTGANLTNVILRRQVDFDVDTGGSLGSGDFTNWFSASEHYSVTAWNNANDHPNDDHAMVVRFFNRTPTTVKFDAKVTEDILDSSCNPVNIAKAAPVQGDYGATMQYNVGTLGGAKSAVLTVQYQRN